MASYYSIVFEGQVEVGIKIFNLKINKKKNTHSDKPKNKPVPTYILY